MLNGHDQIRLTESQIHAQNGNLDRADGGVVGKLNA